MPRKLIIKGKSIRRLNVVAKSQDGYDATTGDEFVVNGRVLDGYVRNSSVSIIDTTTNKIIGSGVSSRDGSYTIDIPADVDSIKIEATGGIDISTEKPFSGQLKTVIKKPPEAKQATANVTPITTVVAAVIEQEPDVEITAEIIEQTKAEVAESLDIQPDEIEKDFIEEKNTKITKKASQVATVIKLTTNALQTTKTAASQAISKALAQAVKTEEKIDLADTTSLETILTSAAQAVTEITNDDTAEKQLVAQITEVASSVQVVTNTIEQIDETIDASIAIEAVAEVNAITDVIVTENIDIVEISNPEVFEEVVEQAVVYQIEKPVAVAPPEPVYTWTQTPHPVDDGDIAVCVGDAYMTVNILNDWKCTIGQFDQISLNVGVLKRLNSVVAGASQSVDLKSNVSYKLKLTGSGRVTFNTDVQATTDSTLSTVSIQNGELLFTCIQDVTSVTVNVIDQQEISQVSIVRVDDDAEMLSNINFDSYRELFYELDGWHLDQSDSNAIDPYSIGWTQGYNEYFLFTLFKDPVIEL